MTDTARHHDEAIGAGQLGCLRTLLAAIRDTNAFQAPRLQAAELDAEVASLDDFAARMPFTTKAELIADQASHPPYGRNLTFPVDRYVRLHQTSSTMGRTPLRWLDTADSWSAMVDDWVTVLEAAGTTPSDRVLAAASFGPFIGFWLAYEAAARMGCLVIPGGGMASHARLRVMREHAVTVLCCTPTYAIRLGEIARAEGIDLGGALRTMIVAGEPGGSVPAVRARIEDLWPGALVFDHHGMTEIGPATYQCPERPGVLHLLESSLFCEFVDPATGEVHAAPTGAVCELVVTTLRRTGSPLLRYRTGDLVRPGPVGRCICGRDERTLEGGVIARADDMLFVRGVNIYPSAVDEIMRARADVAEYRVTISEDRGLTELRVEVEPAAEAEAGALSSSLAEAFRAAFGLRVPVTVVAPGTLPRFEFKARRWVRADTESAP